MKEEQKSGPKSIDSLFPSPAPPLSPPSTSPALPLSPKRVKPDPDFSPELPCTEEKVEAPPVVAAEQVVAQPLNRCLVCRKKVGLIGFKCRCGTTFCGTHRYPEVHGCTFDFKSMGREQIAKANPLIKGEKLVKI